MVGANLDFGGEGGRSTPKQPAHREKIRQFMRTRVGTKNSFYGKQHSINTIARIKASMKGELGPCYGRVGDLHPMFGKQHTPAARAKISAKHLGRKLTPEHIARIKEGHQRRKQLRDERDIQILALLAQGLSRNEVSKKLDIHINQIYGATSRRNARNRAS